jgi:hypothetical protein
LLRENGVTMNALLHTSYNVGSTATYAEKMAKSHRKVGLAAMNAETFTNDNG